MNYEDALKAWGSVRLKQAGYDAFDPDTVTVNMVFQEAGGYSEYTQWDARADVVISADRGYVEIPIEDFDLGGVLREILEAADGTVTSGKH